MVTQILRLNAAENLEIDEISYITLTFYFQQKGVCQIRLDFQKFQLGGPTTTTVAPPTNPGPLPPPVEDPAHSCSLDKFAISSTANLPNGLTICGYTQEHGKIQWPQN